MKQEEVSPIEVDSKKDARSGKWIKALITIFSVFLGIILSNAILSYLDPFKFKSGWRDIFELDSHIGQKHSFVNNLGYRGQNFSYSPNDKVIVLLGDSFVECVRCSDDKLPERILEDAIAAKTGSNNVKVFSLGASGYGADQELLALRDYFGGGYRADAVVLWQTLGNDIWETVFPQRNVTLGIGGGYLSNRRPKLARIFATSILNVYGCNLSRVLSMPTGCDGCLILQNRF